MVSAACVGPPSSAVHAAFSLVAMLPPVALFIALRRYMVRGLSLGVVKG